MSDTIKTATPERLPEARYCAICGHNTLWGCGHAALLLTEGQLAGLTAEQRTVVEYALQLRDAELYAECDECEYARGLAEAAGDDDAELALCDHHAALEGDDADDWVIEAVRTLTNGAWLAMERRIGSAETRFRRLAAMAFTEVWPALGPIVEPPSWREERRDIETERRWAALEAETGE